MTAAREEDTTDGLVEAFRERLSAELDRGATTLRLALAETRLAAGSAALLLGIVLALVVLAVLIWLLLIALAGYALWRAGLSPPLALGILLGAHVLAALALVLLARRLARDLGFVHTRRALAGTPPSGPSSEAPLEPPAGSPPTPPSATTPPPVPPPSHTASGVGFETAHEAGRDRSGGDGKRGPRARVIAPPTRPTTRSPR